jgi:hypothetical protein
MLPPREELNQQSAAGWQAEYDGDAPRRQGFPEADHGGTGIGQPLV